MDKAIAAVESIRDAGPNVFALVRIAGNRFAFRWVNGKLVYRALAQRITESLDPRIEKGTSATDFATISHD